MHTKGPGKRSGPKDASRATFGIVVSRFNEDFTEPMLEGALSALREARVPEKQIHIVRVPGTFEIPYGCITLLKAKKKPNALIAIGCVIKGETDHDRYLASSVSHALMGLIQQYRVPIAFGITTADTVLQAHARAGAESNRGKEAAEAAIDSALL